MEPYLSPYFTLAEQTIEKYNVPTKAIRGKVRDLANQVQLMISHSEFLKSNGKKQAEHLSEMRAAAKQGAKLMQEIQQLAAIELDAQK